MSQNARGDLERGNNPDGVKDGDQPAPNRPPNEEHIFGDSSGPFFSMYSRAAEEEDKKMVESWKKDADGILIFTGLFSAAVAALLGVSVQDLRPNSQDTSAFYLGNIYEVLADPNASTSSPVANPPPFSRPRYAVWVNKLWFLSLVMSLSCALLATLLQQWARRYIRLTQPARRSPEKRARMRAFYANGVDKMHIPWAVEGLPALLHLSLFLFFGGLAIFLFNVDEEVFTSVVCLIGFFLIVYGLITLLPLIRHDSPYYTPLSKPVWFLYRTLYASLTYVLIAALSFIFIDVTGFIHRNSLLGDTITRALTFHFRDLILGGLEKAAEEKAEEQSLKIDIHILDWTISSIGDDHSLEEFFGAIPGLFNSKLVKDLENDFPDTLFFTFWHALRSFMERTLSSNSITDLVKSRRATIIEDIMNIIPCSFDVAPYSDFLGRHPVTIEKAQAMSRWFTIRSRQISSNARIRATMILTRMPGLDDHWIALASEVSGLSKLELQDNDAYARDNILLSTLINVGCPDTDSRDFALFAHIEAFTEFDIRHTLPRLQHDFCALWNELVQKAQSSYIFVKVLRSIHHHYISLHQGTDAVLTTFPDFSRSLNLPWQSQSYPLCNIASHRPDSTAHVYVPGIHAVPRQDQEGIATSPSSESPSNPTTPSVIGDSSQAPATIEHTLIAHTSSHPTDASPSGAVAAALQDVFPASMLSNALERTTQLDIGIIATDAYSTSNDLLSASPVTDFPVPAFPPPSHVPTLPITESLALLSNTTPSYPIDDTTLPHLRTRGLVNTGGMCSANAVLQLLLHSPPFCDQLRELGNLKRHEAGDPATGGSVTPLVDAAMRILDEFTFEEKESPPTQQTLQQASGDNPRKDEEEKKENSAVNLFELRYMYDAMKEKRQLKNFLGYSRGQHAEQFLALFLDALDEELVELHSTREPSSAPSVEELEERARSDEGQAGVGKRDYTVSSVESPISRIFGGRSCSTLRVPSQPDTVTVEAWRSLRLNIQPNSVHTIQDALAYTSQPQPVDVGQYSSNEASQQVILETLPPILVLHLERFVYDAVTEGVDKISKPVQFGPELEIPLEIMAPVFGKSTDPVHYKLHGVLYHHGESAGGHYTVDVFHLDGDGGGEEVWSHIDDEAVNTVRHEDVFRDHGNERVDEGCAYMLFYCRTARTQARS